VTLNGRGVFLWKVLSRLSDIFLRCLDHFSSRLSSSPMNWQRLWRLVGLGHPVGDSGENLISRLLIGF
jgi:hypothetical protein